MAEGAIIPVGRIEQRILPIRGERVMLDADLAALYGVSTKRLNEQVRRNPERFPEDFVFHLRWAFTNCAQIGLASSARGTSTGLAVSPSVFAGARLQRFVKTSARRCSVMASGEGGSTHTIPIFPNPPARENGRASPRECRGRRPVRYLRSPDFPDYASLRLRM